MENVGPGENHGCPYRHHDLDVLKASLIKSGIEAGSDDLNQILQAKNDGHFQKACALQFRASHRSLELSTGITQHPNQFYQESINGGAVVKKSNLKTEKASIYQPLEKEETPENKEQEDQELLPEDQELLMELEKEENGF